MAADRTPARAWLANRWTWPPFGIGPALPDTVRWIDREAIERLPAWTAAKDGERRRLHLPRDAAGALVFVLAEPTAAPDACTLVALTERGERRQWFGGTAKVMTLGSKAARYFDALDEPGGRVWLAEGPADALALSIGGAAGLVRAADGTAGIRRLEAVTDRPDARPVVVVPDADGDGAKAAARLRMKLITARRRCDVIYAEEGDPADWLAAWLIERAAIREYDGGYDREAATAAAWTDVLAAVARGEYLIDPPKE